MNEELSPEDLLRLQVLLAQDLKAVRLDEPNTTLLALTDKGEAAVPLHPIGRPEKYMRLVQELLSGHALGSPGGYPVYLTRWTRHGQMATENLGKLLLIGEPEAVVAVVHSPVLTDELAEYAWWAMPTIENARLMLRREAVAHGRMGKVLADYLVEHLPFLQDDHLAILDTVAVLITSGKLDAQQRLAIWRRGKRTNTYYVPFLEWSADNLPEPNAEPRHLLAEACRDRLADSGNMAAIMLQRACSAEGQTFLAAAAEVLARPETQEVVNHLLNALGARFRPPGASPEGPLSGVPEACAACPELTAEWLAIADLARVSESLVTPIFARSTAIGSLMRRKIGPVVGPLLKDIQTLRGLSTDPVGGL